MRHDAIADKLVTKMLVACQTMRRPRSAEEKRELVEVWAKALSVTDYPEDIYLDALSSWMAEAKAGDNPPYPGDILVHCRRVIERVEVDPVRGPKLRAWRERKRDERDRRVAPN